MLAVRMIVYAAVSVVVNEEASRVKMSKAHQPATLFAKLAQACLFMSMKPRLFQTRASFKGIRALHRSLSRMTTR